MNEDRYESPLSGRYASPYMLNLFSADSRYRTWRRLWAELADAQRKLGLPITEEQVRELFEHTDDIDYEAVRRREQEVHHDVMAHIYAYGLAAPSAAGILHLGATSCYVTDNADLILFREGLRHIRSEAVGLLTALAELAEKYRDLPAPGYTHFQPAQPVTMGKRAALWMQDVITDLEEIDFVLGQFRFLGCRGAVGTEASFLSLFGGDGEKCDAMNDMLCEAFGFDGCFDVCGQTYPRKLDSRILNALSSVAQTCYRMAQDIRLLQHDRQVEEPFGEKQVGSSAMAYKRNPVRCERICSLARYLIADSMNGAMTASVQWLERSLDDSANRRISMPEAFLCADAVLRLSGFVIRGLKVNEAVVEKAVRDQLPFIAMEDLMMEAVKKGADRQAVHEILRRASMKASERLAMGEDPGMGELLAEEEALGLTGEEIRSVLDPARYTGRAPEQVERFLEKNRPLLDGSGPEEEEILL